MVLLIFVKASDTSSRTPLHKLKNGNSKNNDDTGLNRDTIARLVIDRSVAAFKILIKCIGTNILSMDVFKEFVHDLMLELLSC